ncbi:MAG: glycosyltransferase family 1 protein [Rudaea sp.]
MENSNSERVDLVCFSHLRWDSVFQRPHHLMTRFARERRVFFVEEPVREPGAAYMQISRREDGIRVATPHLPPELSPGESEKVKRQLLSNMRDEYGVRDSILWFYTPMAVPLARDFRAAAVVYDCMDELSAFAGAPQALREREEELFHRADLVFTGGQSLYEAKRGKHPSVHLFPSSVEAGHFSRARLALPEPRDQAPIPHPRLGFFGVIDERMDLDLIRGLAQARPDWHLVLLGPVVKINPTALPRRANIHYPGPKPYSQLPAYLAGWDVALLPFARNEATRFISPTKTPEYLAGGKRVVSTGIRDVVRPYAEAGLVRIADTLPDFIAAVEASLSAIDELPEWQRRVEAFLARTSWDKTWEEMCELTENGIAARRLDVVRGMNAVPSTAALSAAAGQ